jgi:tRNA dimethylallyltransferase
MLFVNPFRRCYSRYVPANKPKIIAIVGPTASGKTSLSIALAERFSGEIISADSRQIYRGLDIGTTKITAEEMRSVPHHLIDIIDVDQTFSAHDFTNLATAAISDITARNHTPIVVGGTFFYLDQLRGKAGKAPVPPNPALRAELATLSLTELTARVAAHNPSLLETIDQANPRRLMRAIEILEALGHIPDITTTESPYEWLTIGLEVAKETLRARYQDRAQAWLQAGFLREIEHLIEHGVRRERLQEIGFEYTLGLDLLDQTIDVPTFIERFEQKNWQYAKRQLLWLKRDSSIQWYTPGNIDHIFSTVAAFLQD